MGRRRQGSFYDYLIIPKGKLDASLIPVYIKVIDRSISHPHTLGDQGVDWYILSARATSFDREVRLIGGLPKDEEAAMKLPTF
jgi:hypothetical protein